MEELSPSANVAVTINGRTPAGARARTFQVQLTMPLEFALRVNSLDCPGTSLKRSVQVTEGAVAIVNVAFPFG